MVTPNCAAKIVEAEPNQLSEWLPLGSTSQAEPKSQATVQPCAAAAKTCQHADTQNVSAVMFTSHYRRQQSSP